MGKVTIMDVAKSAGVSKSTVSQYLNGRYSFMSKATQKKIQAAIEELNYVPNEIARSLTFKKSNTVGVIVSNIASQFTIDLVRAIERKFAQENIQLLLCNTDNNPEREQQYLSSLSARQVDGVILFPNSENRSYYQALNESDFPLVFVDRTIPDLEVLSVTLDNECATRLATQHLIDNGHQAIALVTYPYSKSGVSNRKGRVIGYLETLKENGIDESQVNVFEIEEYQSESAFKQILMEPSITGLVLTSDVLLEAFLIFAKKEGTRIPEELSIVSIDDATFAIFHNPMITTIKQPASQIGELSAELLLDLMNGTDKEMLLKESPYQFQPEICLRESVYRLREQ